MGGAADNYFPPAAAAAMISPTNIGLDDALMRGTTAEGRVPGNMILNWYPPPHDHHHGDRPRCQEEEVQAL